MNILKSIKLNQDPIEITRSNWIIGSFFDTVHQLYYELHYCNNDFYTSGLLIDDTWAQSLYDISGNEKIDIYVLYKCGITNNFVLRDEYCYFLNCKKVKKEFLLFDEIEESTKIFFSSFCRLDSSYSSIAKNIKLSVVTTVFNNALLLEQTIQSVINQQATNFEYIVKDAYSTDQFDEVVQKYTKFGIRVIKSKDNGIYDGMSQGFEAAFGEYVQILNSDDVFYNSQVISAYIKELNEENADAYCSDIKLFFSNGEKRIRRPNLKKLRYQSCINHTSLALRKVDFFTLGGFDRKLKIAADAELTIKMVKEGFSFKRLPIVCVNFRIGGTSSGMSWSQLIEGLICRYRYSKLNIDGYLFTILQFLKNRIIKTIIQLFQRPISPL